MEYKTILGYLTLLIAIISYSFYFKDIFLGKTKPHAFSWFVWSVLSGVAFLAQLVDNAGPGSWITGFTAVVCFIISVIASFKGSEKFKLIDWFSLLTALLALILWKFSSGPNLAVALVSMAYTLGFIPTFRKAYFKPKEETATTFGLNSFKFFLAIFALNSFSVSTALYPTALVLTNFSFVIMLLVRRRQLK